MSKQPIKLTTYTRNTSMIKHSLEAILQTDQTLEGIITTEPPQQSSSLYESNASISGTSSTYNSLSNCSTPWRLFPSPYYDHILYETVDIYNIIFLKLAVPN